MKKVQDEVESWDIDAITPYPGNAKIHTDEQVAGIAKSIQTFGFDQPIVIDSAGVIIKGHGRRMAALSLGMKKVPVIVRNDLTANEANASRLADNRVAQGDVDTELLNQELEAIAGVDEELLASMGFTDKELEFMTTDLGAMDEDMLIDSFSSEMESENVSEAIEDSKNVSGSKIAAKDVLGFTHLTGDQAKVIARFISLLQGEHETDAAEALAIHAEDILGNV